MATLYIFGNGFDLHHGFKTSYDDFRKYVMVKRPDLYEKIETYNKNNFFNGELGKNWSDIEKALELNAGGILAKANKKTEFNPEIICKNILYVFKNMFREWVLEQEKSIETTDRTKADLKLDCNDYYFTFNYTKTLEYLYGVTKIENTFPHIMFIHNSISDPWGLIFGRYSNIKRTELEQNQALCSIYKSFQKPTDQKYREKCGIHISLNPKIGKDLPNIETIKVYGHSLNFEFDEDKKLIEDGYYFEQIRDAFPKANWVFYYYKKTDIPIEIEAIKRLSLGGKDSSIRPESELYKDKNSYLSRYGKKAIKDNEYNKLLDREKLHN